MGELQARDSFASDLPFMNKLKDSVSCRAIHRTRRQRSITTGHLTTALVQGR